MTLEETRQLGIEFERRLQIIDPQYEIVNKLDTETIYSFLNEYLIKYVTNLLLASSQPVEDKSKINKLMLSKIQGILRSNSEFDDKTQLTNESDSFIEFPLDDIDFMYYIHSTSKVNKSYNGNSGILNNILISNSELDKLNSVLYDKDRILRNPIAILMDHAGDLVLRVYYDRYTVDGNITLNIYYYKKPAIFTPLKNKPCELPIECFDDLVTGAIELFLSNKYRLLQKNTKNKEKNDE